MAPYRKRPLDVNKNQSGICVTMTTLNTIIEELLELETSK